MSLIPQRFTIITVGGQVNDSGFLHLLRNYPRLMYAGHIIKRVYIEFRKDECTREANAMAYRTIFSIVPILAIFLTIFTAVHTFNRFKGRVLDIITTYLVPSAKDILVENMGRMADNTQALGGISFVATLVVALYLFNAIEMAFNRIWEVPEKRGFFRKFTAFTAILLWSPVFLGLSFYLTGLIQTYLPWLRATAHVGLLSRLILRMLPIFFSWAALTIIFVVVPNTRVNYRAAAAGALFASVGWEVVKVGFNIYVVHAVNYSKVYGSLSVIPRFNIGRYLLWVVVFLGVEITYVLHNYRYHEDWSEQDWTGYKAYLGVGLMLEIGGRFHTGQNSIGIEEMARDFRVAIPVLREVLLALSESGLLTRAEDDHYSPARDLHLITLEEVIDATVEKAAAIRRISSSAEQIIQKMSVGGAKRLGDIFETAETHLHKTLGTVTIDDLMEKPGMVSETLKTGDIITNSGQ